jgi:nuclear transport factor 2 (NTF2) superfamily protein
LHHKKKLTYVFSILILVFLVGPFGGPFINGEGAEASIESLSVDKQQHIQRLNASEYPPGSYIPGEVAVMLEKPTLEELGKLLRDFAAILEEGVDELLGIFKDIPMGAATGLQLRPDVGELEAARLLTASPLVKLAEPNLVFRASVTTPNDPKYGQQWNLQSSNGVNANQAWDLQRGSAGTTVAVIDTGIDYYHQDLVGRRSGGYDFLNNDPDPWDDNGHGTQVSGVICANTDNLIGQSGLDWFAKVMPLKALGASGEGSLDAVVSSINYAANSGVDVINMSLTSSTYSLMLQDAVEYAHSKGCILVASVGNEGDSRVDYPAGLTYVIGVGATGRTGSRAYFSNYNYSVDLASPGVDILGPYPDDSYVFGFGTSDACPHVSGAGLLLLADEPGLAPDQAWRRLRDSARDLGSPGYDPEYGWGLLDIYSALNTPLVEILSPQEYSYPTSGKVTANARNNHVNIRFMELWVDGDLKENVTVPAGHNVNCTFNNWDLDQLSEGTHTITVKAIESGGQWEGERNITVYRNQTQPRPAQDWFLAEGTTAWGFEEYVLIQNPNAAPADVNVTFMKPDGTTPQFGFAMAGYSRLTIPVNSLVPESDVSTYVRADQPVVAERAMYWGNRTGGHVAVGTNTASDEWFLAEGTTAWGFEEYVLIQNPNASPANVNVTFMKPDGTTQQFGYAMTSNSRLTLHANSLVPGSDISTKVQADRPVVAERAMYWGNRTGGHATLGVTDGCATWFLPEGTTAWGFEEYLLIQNPGPFSANVIFDFLKPGGDQIRYATSVGPDSRYTLNVAEVVPGSDVSTQVTADQPVIAERAMYWGDRKGGHVSTGSVTSANTWYLAEGTTAWGFDEYVLLANPTQEIAHTTLVFMRTDGSTWSYPVDVPARSRFTVYANEVDPDRDASVQVISDVPIAVERSMYWSDKEGGTDALGVLEP